MIAHKSLQVGPRWTGNCVSSSLACPAGAVKVGQAEAVMLEPGSLGSNPSSAFIIPDLGKASGGFRCLTTTLADMSCGLKGVTAPSCLPPRVPRSICAYEY
jgi:hypothetical protein